MIAQRPETRAKRITLWILAIVILLPGAYGFGVKLWEFINEVKQDDGVGFTVFPISNYFLVTAGMACLLVWAIAHGMFRNVEGPKYTMLDRENELDRREQLDRSH
jgi:hypothetical protein